MKCIADLETEYSNNLLSKEEYLRQRKNLDLSFEEDLKEFGGQGKLDKPLVS